MKTNFQNVRGMQDLFNEQADKYNLVVNTARQVSETYNFHEIITPIVEESNLFERSVGDGSDIVMKELYKFEDRGGNLLALRPEFTAGIARSFLNNSELNQSLPQKLFSYGPLFRYDRPQKGRYRQLNQINFEYIGNKEYIADVEIIYLFYTVLQKLGLKNITLEINSLGSNECKKRYELALKEYFTKFKDKLSEDSKVRLEKNPLRILDSKEECDKALVKDAPKISEFYTEEEKEFYSNILKTLDKLGVSYFSNPLLVRGLDYYTSTVFEYTTTDLGAQSSVGGGGRYDNLIGEIGNEDVPSVGCAGGIERLMLLINKEIKKEKELIAIIPISENENDYCIDLATKLRNQGKNIELIYSGKFKKKMEKMNKCNADYAIIVGEDEVKSGKLKIKDLKTSQEEEFKL